MKRIYLIADSGYEHYEVVAAVVGPEFINIAHYLREFEDTVGCHPIQFLKHYKEGSKEAKKYTEFLSDLKARLIHLNLLEDYADEFYRDKCSMSDFLLAFAKWLEKEKGFIQLNFEEVGYYNCGLQP